MSDQQPTIAPLGPQRVMTVECFDDGTSKVNHVGDVEQAVRALRSIADQIEKEQADAS